MTEMEEQNAKESTTAAEVLEVSIIY